MGKTWKAFSSVSLQISLQKSGGLQLRQLKSLHLWKVWFSKSPFSAKYFKLSTILIIFLKRNRLNQVFQSFFPLLPIPFCNAAWNTSVSPSCIKKGTQLHKIYRFCSYYFEEKICIPGCILKVTCTMMVICSIVRDPSNIIGLKDLGQCFLLG